MTYSTGKRKKKLLDMVVEELRDDKITSIMATIMVGLLYLLVLVSIALLCFNKP